MNCANCGAAMQLVESRRYFTCGHCGSYHFPESVEAEGIQIVGQPAGAPGCPVCAVPMAHALIDRDPIDFCTKCRGILIPRPTFAKITLRRRAWATTAPADPVPIDRQELHRRLACPKCRGHFDTYPHLGPGSVVIDNCTRCDLLWLDFGEMRKIVDAPGTDRGSHNVPRFDPEFVREGAARPAPLDDDDEDDWTARRANDPLTFLLSALFRD